MRFPVFSAVKRENRVLTGFGGYVHSANAGENTFYDMADMTSDGFPLLCARPLRKRWSVKNAPDGYFPDGRLILSDDEIQSVEEVSGRAVFCTKRYVYADGEKIPGVTLEDISPLKHRIAAFGRSFMVYPDGIFFEPDSNGYTVKHAKYCMECPNALVSICDPVGNVLTADAYGDVLPEEGEDGGTFVVTGEGHSYIYTYSDGAWSEPEEVYLTISASDIDRYAYNSEPVIINGLSGHNDRGVIADHTSGSVRLRFESRLSSALLDCGGSLVVNLLQMKREMPELDFVCEHGNRLWGCRYGDDGKGGFVNEICASALGDATVWDSFEGISTDSYRVSLGCGGDFTGICSLGGDIVCFKENYIIRVTGSDPSDFYITTVPARGVEKGASPSLAVLNEKAFYRSESGITVYDGALPYIISESLGGLEYECRGAGRQRGKYYVAVKEKNGGNAVLVYDTARNMWHRESDTENIETFVPIDGQLFAVCNNKTDDENVYSFWCMLPAANVIEDIFRSTPIDGAEYDYIEETPPEWYVQTGNICAKTPGSRVVRCIGLHMEASKDAQICISVRCNNDNEFRRLCLLNRPDSGYFAVTLNTPRCDGFSLKISGKGGFTLHEMNIITEKSGEVNRYV